MKVNTIYLDMDGVLTDFDKKYRELFGSDPALVRHNKARCNNWEAFVQGKHFEHLDWHSGGQELLRYLKTLKVNIEILSSSGGEKFHDEVTRQKLAWLKKHHINYKANIVAGRRLKADYANQNAILIDDTKDNVEQFYGAGGHGIYHTDVHKTIGELIANID